MDIVGTSLSAAQTLFAALQSSQLKDILEILGYESQLEDLKRTVETVTAVLRAAETKHELSGPIRVLIEQLKDAVFEADDLMDEFATLAEQKKILKADGTLSEKAGRFLTRANRLGVAYRMSRGVKKIRKRLDGIAYNKQFNFEHNCSAPLRFNFEHDPAPLRSRRPETCSYVNEFDIIGRQADLDNIVGMLVDGSNVQNDVSVSFLSIVGIGGLGKTALAQLVFNDPRVTSAFPLMRLWTCVADQDQKQLDVAGILRMILASATNGQLDKDSTLDSVQSQLRLKLKDERFLLVLDDVWTEDGHDWRDLVQYLIGGGKGSWIVVTTRSQETAKIIGGLTYDLPGLSEDDSWSLFEKTASPPQDLVSIGQQIVHGCARVPLAIRVAGSLLYGQGESRWRSVQKLGIANFEDEKNGIMSILKLSYNHLESELKSCFSYCALFPKDFEIEKEMLIELWIAQSYIVPRYNGQSIEDVAEEYFTILLRRCFFQDIKKDKSGEIESCKIHDLMHDIARNASSKEIYALNTTTNSGNIDNIKVRHLSIVGEKECGKYILGKKYIRSLLSVDLFCHPWFAVEKVIANCRWLRALDLSCFDIETLPSSIGELLHLRYLDLSRNDFLKVLPNSITKLCNLQTLRLAFCNNLKELPKDLSRLTKLRVLNIRRCFQLTYMPKGIGKLTNLERLNGSYILGRGGNCSSWKEWFYELEDLKALLTNLRGQLVIDIWWPVNAVDSWSWREGLDSKPSAKHLNSMLLIFKNHIENDGTWIRLMEELQPHANLKELWVARYNGVKMPGWATATSLLSLEFWDCGELKYLPLSSSLETLSLSKIPKLKGLGVEESSVNTQSQQLLPCLLSLEILNCAELTCDLRCPKLECLILDNYNEGLRIVASKLRDVIVGETACLNSLSMESCNNIQSLTIKSTSKMEYPPNHIRDMSNLQVLTIHDDHGSLKAMPNWMSELTSLQKLKLYGGSNRLRSRCQKDPPGED